MGVPLVEQGFVVYMVDYPARGRSAYVPLQGADGKTPLDGNLSIRTALELERIWTNARERGDFPLKMNHTQWPGAGKMGDPVFDIFMKTQVQFAGATGARAPPPIALLDTIGTPVILFAHSQGGGFGFDITESRPNLVRAMVSAEPGGPQFGSADTAKVTPGRATRTRGASRTCGTSTTRRPTRRRSAGRARGEVGAARRSALLDAGGAGAEAGAVAEHPVLITANGTYHRVYDPCIPKFLKQAGVPAEFVRLEEVGISGNSHMMMSRGTATTSSNGSWRGSGRTRLRSRRISR